MLSKLQKYALILGAGLMWGDQISDIVMGISYWLNCHYLWATLSAVFTAMPTVLAILIATLSCVICKDWDDKEHLAIILSMVFCQPFFATYLVYGVLTDEDIDEEGKVEVFMIKGLKTLEILLESIPQLLLNGYVRCYLAPGNSGDSWSIMDGIQLMSIVFSLAAVLHAVGDRFACYYGKTQLPGISDVAKAQMIIAFDLILKLSVIVLSSIMFGFPITIGWILGLTVILFIPNIILSLMDSGFNPFFIGRKVAWFIDMLHFNLKYNMLP